MMVSMIPFGLLAGFIGEKEVRITELDENSFYFRVWKKSIQCMESLPFLKVCFYDLENGKYNEIGISKYRWQVCLKEDLDFYVKIEVMVELEVYTQAVEKLLFQYNKYIHLKLEDDDSMLAKSMTGYPGGLDVVRCSSLEAQVKIWRQEVEAEETKVLPPVCLKEEYARDLNAGNPASEASQGDFAACCENEIDLPEVALELDRPEIYQAYLSKSLEKFSEKFAQKSAGTCSKILMEKKLPDRLYIGNQFCHLLFPDREQLFQMLEKAVSEQVEITIAFSYIREYRLDFAKELLDEIDQWCEEKRRSAEVVVNDWGMASLVKKYGKNLIPCLGILLNKRKKDPRISYKKGDQKLFEMNNLNARFYRDYLEKEYGIQRFEWESCGYEQQLSHGKNSLHIPFYQTNTSQYCPLRAVCESGERGWQRFAKECPKYCEKYALLYPEHLHMMGRYNSLFGIDMGILKEQGKLEKYVRNGIDRVVLNTL